MKMPIKKMLHDWYSFWLDDFWWVAMTIEIKAVQWSDDPDEPYATPALKVQLHSTKRILYMTVTEGIIFPQRFPRRLREKTLKIINETLDQIEDYDFSEWVQEQTDAECWPPPEHEWEWKQVDEDEDEDEDE